LAGGVGTLGVAGESGVAEVAPEEVSFSTCGGTGAGAAAAGLLGKGGIIGI